MPAHTSLVEFRVPEVTIQNPMELKTIKQEIGCHLKRLKFSQVKVVVDDNGPGFLMLFIGQNSSHATVRGYAEGLVTIDITEFVDSSKSQFPDKVIENFVKEIKGSIAITKVTSLPIIKRGAEIESIFPTTDNLLIQYDFDKCVFEEDSPYQNVKIMHSNQYGNVLILDNDVNLAESDLVYTRAITGYGRENYQDKSVLILGGGDGGILHEILKQSPKWITMVDIDRVVVEAATKHLRGICYDSLDKLNGDNYEVLIEDCVPVLHKYKCEGKMFDYVINDLTAIPCTNEPVGDHWDFLRLILNLSMKVLAPSGKYYTQGNGANMVSSLAMYEKQLAKLEMPVEFRTQTVCVPSYHEMWVFYEIWKKGHSNPSGKKNNNNV